MPEWYAEAELLQKRADKLARDLVQNKLPEVDHSKEQPAGPYFEVVKEVRDRLDRVLICQKEYALFLQDRGVTPEMAKLCASVDYLESICNELNAMCTDLNKNARNIWSDDKFKEILDIYENYLFDAVSISAKASDNIEDNIKSADFDLQHLNIAGLLDPRIKREIVLHARANGIKPEVFFEALRGRLDLEKAKVPAEAGKFRAVFHVLTQHNPIEFDQRDVEILKVKGKIAWYAFQTAHDWPLV